MRDKKQKIHIPPGVTAKELAKESNTSVPNVYRWLREGVVEGYRLGGRTFITIESVNQNLVRPWTPRGDR